MQGSRSWQRCKKVRVSEAEPPFGGGIIRRYYASLPLHISLIIYINI